MTQNQIQKHLINFISQGDLVCQKCENTNWKITECDENLFKQTIQCDKCGEELRLSREQFLNGNPEYLCRAGQSFTCGVGVQLYGNKIDSDHKRVFTALIIFNNRIIFEYDDLRIPLSMIRTNDGLVSDTLSWALLKPGDTDADYFTGYTQEQLDFIESPEADEMRIWVNDIEEKNDN